MPRRCGVSTPPTTRSRCGAEPRPTAILISYTYFDSHGAIGQLTGYSNKQLESLLDRARVTLSRAQRKPLYEQAQKIIFDDAPWFPLVYREQAEASASYVQGYTRVLGSNWNGIHYAKLWMAK